MTEKTLNTIIVLRNGTKEAWEAEGSYVLKAGEVGVGYMDVTNSDGVTVKTVPIVKIGDNETSWKDLPQAEGVFEQEVVLTSALGKYVPGASGFIKVPNSKGMTTSELLLDALSEVKEPTITPPSFTLSATSGSRTVEIGSKITSLAWTSTFDDGEYEYGSTKGTTTYSKDDGAGQSATGYVVTCSLPGTADQKNNGSVVLTTPYVVSESKTNFASVTSTCFWNASDRTPLNNVGVETGGILGAGSSEKKVYYSVTAYREGFFYGVTTDKTNSADLDGKLIRNLGTVTVSGKAKNRSNATYKAGTTTLTVPVGTSTIIFACPATKTGITKVFNDSVFADMTDEFGTPTTVTVGGADATDTSDGSYTDSYNVWTYTPVDPYGTETKFTITLG